MLRVACIVQTHVNADDHVIDYVHLKFIYFQ